MWSGADPYGQVVKAASVGHHQHSERGLRREGRLRLAPQSPPAPPGASRLENCVRPQRVGVVMRCHALLTTATHSWRGGRGAVQTAGDCRSDAVTR